VVEMRAKKGILWSCILIAVLMAAASGCSLLSGGKTESAEGISFEKAVVARVVDGDTVVLSDGRRVRFIGVDSPESTSDVEFYGKEASEYTKSQLTGKTVYLEKDVSETDKYGRLIRYVWLSLPSEISDSEIRGKMYNAILVLEGYAQAGTYPPDVRYQDYLTRYNSEARSKEKGLWNKDN
jgi:micrococcal nuclease